MTIQKTAIELSRCFFVAVLFMGKPIPMPNRHDCRRFSTRSTKSKYPNTLLQQKKIAAAFAGQFLYDLLCKKFPRGVFVRI